jgi:Right handed beta helix region
MKLLSLILLLPCLVMAQPFPSRLIQSSGIFINPDNEDIWAYDDLNLKYVPFGNMYSIYRQMISVSNVTEMVKLPAGTNALNKLVQTMGYYAPGDGGAGMYTQVPMTTTNMGRFASTNSAYMWQLALQDNVYIRQYGAKGDGTNDDSQAFLDFIADSNNKTAVLNIGIYSIKPCNVNGNITLVGARPIPAFAQSTGLESGYATLLRRAGSGMDAVGLIQVLTGTGNQCHVKDVVFDGNKANELTATNVYLYINNNAKPSALINCVFQNSAGHACGFASVNCSGSMVRNCRIFDVVRGIRVNGANDLEIDSCIVQKTRESAIWLVGGTYDHRVHDCLLSDGLTDAITVECSGSRFENITMRGYFQSGICFNVTNTTTALNNRFLSCNISDINCQTNAFGANTYTNGQWAAVRVAGTVNSVIATRNVFMNCFIADRGGSTGLGPSYGTWGPRYIFEWTAPTGGSFAPWEQWQFIANQHMWNPVFVADYQPVTTNNVVEIGVSRGNTYFYNNLGTAGGINPSGWRVDIVEGGGSTTADLLTSDDITHRLKKSGAGHGTPVTLSDIPPDRMATNSPGRPEPE